MSWQATHGYCAAVDHEALEFASNVDELVVLEVARVDPWDLYLQCFFWGTGMIAGFTTTPLQGPLASYYYPFGPGTVFDRMEQMLLLVIYLIAAFQWTYITGKVFDLIANSNPDRMEFLIGLDKLNDFIRFFNLDFDTGVKLREFYVRLRRVEPTQSYESAMPRACGPARPHHGWGSEFDSPPVGSIFGRS